MTQVVKLLTGISAPAKDADFLKHDQSGLVLEQFASVLNQNAGSLAGKTMDFAKKGGGASDEIFSLGKTAGSAQKDYAKFSKSTRTIAEAKTDTVNTSDFGQKVSQLAGKVEEAVQETMQVSDEEFAQAMETLGFSPIDLLNPQNLIQIVQELFGGGDVGALLVDANFQMALQQVNGLIQEFQQENGIDAGIFGDLLAQLSAQIDEMEEKVQEILGSGEASPEQMQEQMEQFLEEAFGIGETEETTPKTPETVVQAADESGVSTVQTAENLTVSEEGTAPLTDAKEEMQTAVPVVEEASQQSAQDGNGESASADLTGGKPDAKLTAPQTKEQAGGDFEHAPVFREAEVPVNLQQMMPQTESLQPAFHYLEVEQLMNQMEGLARAFASAEGTTLSMQLNPESLGRIFLTVTEKQGAVTAQIAASNEQVKEALQTQMAELRSTLQAQGLKVEAVEVTVATHEFEQNLDGNASANGQMAQEQAERQGEGAQGGRRNLNLNNLDELSGLMSEEETLVAQMMRDNGGTVDYTA